MTNKIKELLQTIDLNEWKLVYLVCFIAFKEDGTIDVSRENYVALINSNDLQFMTGEEAFDIESISNVSPILLPTVFKGNSDKLDNKNKTKIVLEGKGLGI